eukprot:507640-Pelagomonas_calceolata.AAC.1
MGQMYLQLRCSTSKDVSVSSMHDPTKVTSAEMHSHSGCAAPSPRPGQSCVFFMASDPSWNETMCLSFHFSNSHYY